MAEVTPEQRKAHEAAVDHEAAVGYVRSIRPFVPDRCLNEPLLTYVAAMADAAIVLAEALRDIEMETMDGGQWGMRDVNEVAIAAISAFEQARLARS